MRSIAGIDFTVHLVGANKLQNKLLSKILVKELGCPVVEYPKWQDRNLSGSSQLDMFLVDCDGVCYRALREKICRKVKNNFLVALFNLKRGGNECEALLHGVRGIFFNEDPPESVVKGVGAIIKGELWFPRKIMSQALEQSRVTVSEFADNTLEFLTFREQEILSLMTEGYSNKNISSRLGISLHTVKTHIYNTYRKINVNNRMQAIKWADQYIHGH